MKKNCFRKVQKCLKENVRFITCYKTKKTTMFCSAKDSVPKHQKANVIYKITCLGYNEDYIGKTDCNLVTKLNEHASREDEPMYQHCEHLDILLVYIDYQILLLQQQRSITNHTLLTLLILTFVFWTPAVTGPNCYF